jgi:glycosyltransferase involved in cell wall biosynthesis
MTRLLIVEEALRDREGHWFEYNRATKAAVTGALDVEVDMLGHHTMEESVADELVAKPHFRFTVWDQIYNQPQAFRRYFGIGLHNYRLYWDLARYFKRSAYYDTVFAPTVVLHHLLGYHRIAKRFGGHRFQQLVLLIRNNIALYDSEGHRTFCCTAKFWRWAIQRFRPLIAEGRVRFVTDSERLADEYEELTGIRFDVLPHPSLVDMPGASAETPTVNHADSQTVRIFLPGPARHEKGVVRLLEAARLLADEKLERKIRITLQWREAFDLPDGSRIGPDDVGRYESENVSLRIIREPLSSEAYLQELQNADAIILPYRREAYYARISGVAVEAMMLGKPLLFTTDTWIDTVCQQFELGVGMDDDVSGVTSTLAKIAEEIPKLKSEAIAKQPAVAELFSARAFRTRLMATTG